MTAVNAARPLEPDDEQWRALAATTVEYLAGVLREIPALPAAVLDGAALPPATAPPEQGRPLAELLDTIDRAARPGLNPSSPGYLAFIPGSGLVSAGLADLVADVLNRYTGLAFPAPGLVALEAGLLRWLADLFALPTGAGGLFTSGGSLATFSALVAAREDRLPEDFRRGTLYVTDQAHASVAKAALLAGFPRDAVRVVECDARHHMDVDALARLAEADRGDGRVPFCVVATAGTTNLGVIDPLPEIAALCRRQELWLHVDGAYGAAFQLTARGRDRLRGIEHADSITLDPHKGFFLPFGTGCLLVRDTAPLRASHAADDAHYLQDLASQELPDFADLGPELTRGFRGIRLWLPLHLHGVAAFRDALDEKLDLAVWAHEELSRVPSLTLLGPPELTILGFHAADDATTAELLARVNAEQRVFLSSTRVEGRFVGRVAILNHRTDKDRVAEAVDAIRRHAAEVC